MSSRYIVCCFYDKLALPQFHSTFCVPKPLPPLIFAEQFQHMVSMELYEAMFMMWRRHCEGPRHAEPICNVFGYRFAQAILPSFARNLRRLVVGHPADLMMVMEELVVYMNDELKKVDSNLWCPQFGGQAATVAAAAASGVSSVQASASARTGMNAIAVAGAAVGTAATTLAASGSGAAVVGRKRINSKSGKQPPVSQ